MDDEKLIRFMESQKKAKALINMDINGELNKYRKNKEDYSDLSKSSTLSEEKIINKTKNIEIDKKKSKLPDEILESFINEQIDVSTPTPSTSKQEIDYGKIQTMIEETIKNQFTKMKKTLLNEQTNNLSSLNELQALKIGNKFSFITKNGDLYEANLKFIKNIKK